MVTIRPDSGNSEAYFATLTIYSGAGRTYTWTIQDRQAKGEGKEPGRQKRSRREKGDQNELRSYRFRDVQCTVL